MLDQTATVLVTTSPIPSHAITTARTAIIDKTLRSIRHHLPTAKILILADDVRPQIEFRRNDYEIYKRELKTKLQNGDFGNAELIEFDTYTQQARMIRAALGRVQTPLVFFIEHDTDLVVDVNPRDGHQETVSEDLKTDWDHIEYMLLSGWTNQVRLYFFQEIPKEHIHLMCGYLPIVKPGMTGNPVFMKTRQYSQWPNIARKDFYERLMNYFHPKAINMMEIPLATVVACRPWEEFKVTLYYPQPNARRFWHQEGRIDKRNGQKDPCDW